MILNSIKKVWGQLIALVIEAYLMLQEPVEVVTAIDMKGEGLKMTGTFWLLFILMSITIGTIVLKLEKKEKEESKVVVTTDDLSSKTSSTPEWLEEIFNN